MIKLHHFFYFCMLLTSSCTKYMDFPVTDKGRFVEVLKENTFGFSYMIESIKSLYPSLDESQFNKILPLLDTSASVTSTAISYLTLDPRGNEILASGLIMRPANGQSKGLLIFFPSAKIDKYNVGSETLMTFEGVLSFFGYTVIIPDLLGYGVSKQVEYPFLFSDNTARVAYDMHLSAAEYFSTTGLPFPREVTLGGYSMAGMGVVSLHRYIEQNHPGNIIIRESITGGGIYDLGLAVDLFSEIKYCESPFVPFIFKSLDYWYDLNLNYSEVFIEPLLSHRNEWLNGTHSRAEMLTFIQPDMTTYMHPDFFTKEKNASLRKIDSCLRLHSVAKGWAPQSPLTLVHSRDDDMAPPAIAQYTYDNLSKAGGNISLIWGSGDHLTHGVEYYLAMMAYLLAR
ncbi:MAG: hypothetical protein WC079_06860 [Bacteroidales bacterium]